MAYPLPPWLQAGPDDTARMYSSGLQLGAQISHQRAVLQQQAEQEQTRLAVHQQQVEKELQMEIQKTEMARAMHEAQMALRSQQLQTQQDRVTLATTMAARRFAASEAYRRRVTAGEDASKVALELGPEMGMTGAGLSSMYRQAQPKPTIPPAGVETFGGKPFLAVPHPGGWKNYVALDRSSGSNMGERNLRYRAVSSELNTLLKNWEGALDIPSANKEREAARVAAKKRIAELQSQQHDIAFGTGGTSTATSGAKRWTYDYKTGKLVQAPAGPTPQDLANEPDFTEEGDY